MKLPSKQIHYVKPQNQIKYTQFPQFQKYITCVAHLQGEVTKCITFAISVTTQKTCWMDFQNMLHWGGSQIYVQILVQIKKKKNMFYMKTCTHFCANFRHNSLTFIGVNKSGRET
jgi:hypothetical protein